MAKDIVKGISKRELSREKKQFLLGLGVFMGVYVLSYVWVLYITPIASSAASLYALISFVVGVAAAIVLIFSRHSLVGLGGSLASILFVVLFAVTWPFLH